MKIVYIYHSIALWGGVERIFAEKMNYLAEVYGHDIYLITSEQGKHPFSFPISGKIKHIDLNVNFHFLYKHKMPFRIWQNWSLNRTFKKRLKTAIHEIEPDIIIGTPYFKAEVISQLQVKGVKLVESHNARSYTGFNDGVKRNVLAQWLFNIRQRWTQHIIESKSDLIVTLTEGDAQEWNKARKVCVIPNMTRHEEISAKTILKNKRHVIGVGRLEYQKGFDQLVDTWKIVTSKHPNWVLDIYGCGSLNTEIQHQIERLSLTENIHIQQPTADIIEKYTESEFNVLSSRYEGWGLVLVEAMTCGLPCIAFDCPYGPSDIIEHGKNGLLVKNGDIEGLADAICWMIENEEERKQMGIAAKETSKKYAPEVIMKQWDELFKELVKQ